MQKPQEQTDRLPPPRTLIMDFTLTHTCFGHSNVYPIGQLTHTRRSDGAPEPDGALKAVARAKIIHYRQLYLNRPDPIAFMTVSVDTSVTIQVTSTMTLVVYYFCTLTVKHRPWLMNYRRNRINFVFFALFA